jgi:hypothetical protein
MCVLYEDLKVDEDIMIDGNEDWEANEMRAYYTTTDGIRIIPNDTSWYSDPDPNSPDYDEHGGLYYSDSRYAFEQIPNGAFCAKTTLTSYKTFFR